MQYSGAGAGGGIAICCVNTSAPQPRPALTCPSHPITTAQHPPRHPPVLTTAVAALPVINYSHLAPPPPFSLRYVIHILLLIVRVVCFVYNVQTSDQSIYSILFYALPNNRDKMRAKPPNYYPYILVKT